MIHTVVMLLRVVLFTVGSAGAVADTVAPAGGLQIDGTLDPITNTQLVDAIIAVAPAGLTAALAENAVEPAASRPGGANWADEGESGMAYAVSGRLSLGLTYEHEGIEDLTAELIEMGTAGVDYTSHNVLVRANVSLDFIP